MNYSRFSRFSLNVHASFCTAPGMVKGGEYVSHQWVPSAMYITKLGPAFLAHLPSLNTIHTICNSSVSNPDRRGKGVAVVIPSKFCVPC